jgi:cellulose synthase/poly-beta-1,6-N-acetylglucosamine synthase-like glycosyltransferase
MEILIYSYIVTLSLLALFNIYKIRLLINYFRYKKHPLLPQFQFGDLPRVTVQLPVYNEKYVVSRLILSTCRIDYPREKLQIQVLDDSTDATCAIARRLAKKLKAKGFQIEHIHRDHRVGFKAGALQNGLTSATGEYVAIFDADFIPPQDFLHRTIHHFTNPKVGLVQARWGFTNTGYSILTRIQSIFLNGHFVVEHIAKNRSGSFFNFNGTAGIWRKATVLDAGGWHSDTITEDLDLSYRAQLAGWEFIYVPDLVVESELPITINMLKNQQFRWTKGMTQCAKKLIPQLLRADITRAQKFDAIMHLLSNSGYLNTTLLSLLIVPTLIIFKMFFKSWPIFFVLFYFGANFLSIILYYVIVETEAEGFRWSHFKDVFMMIIVGIATSLNSSVAIIEAWLGKESEFVRTPKFLIDGKGKKVGTHWKHKGYKIPFNKAILLEIIFLVYFIFNTVWCLASRQYHLIPVLVLFLFSYTYAIYLYYSAEAKV